jgi:hypothetical protein
MRNGGGRIEYTQCHRYCMHSLTLPLMTVLVFYDVRVIAVRVTAVRATVVAVRVAAVRVHAVRVIGGRLGRGSLWGCCSPRQPGLPCSCLHRTHPSSVARSLTHTHANTRTQGTYPSARTHARAHADAGTRTCARAHAHFQEEGGEPRLSPPHPSLFCPVSTARIPRTSVLSPSHASGHPRVSESASVQARISEAQAGPP